MFLSSSPSRAICAVCIAAFTGVFSHPATASDGFCDGKYDTAREMLNAAYGNYGTLYSGGNFFSHRDDIGATLDLYRLWRGLPDLQFRAVKHDRPYEHEDLLIRYRNPDRSWKPEFLNDALRIALTPDDPKYWLAERYVAAVGLDMYTSAGKTPDWWLRPVDAGDVGNSRKRIADLARTEPLLNWLQYTLAASDGPWTIAPHYTSNFHLNPAYQDLRQSAQRNFTATGGIEWLVAASLFPKNATPLPNDMKEALAGLEKAVEDCSASAPEYAAHAVVLGEGAWGKDLSRISALPRKMGEHVLQNLILRAVGNQWQHFRAIRNPKESRAAYLANIAVRFEELSEGAWSPEVWRNTDRRRAAFQAWLNVGRTYLAGSVAELAEIHGTNALDGKTLRALNLLSTDDLLHFARADGRLEEDHRLMVKTAFARYFTLGRYQDAAALLLELKHLYPEHEPVLEEIMAQSWPLKVRVALTILELPEPSVWMIGSKSYHISDAALWPQRRVHTRMDMPHAFRTAAFLQRDLEVWTMHPERWNAYRGVRGFSVGSIARQYSRHRVKQHVASSPLEFLPTGHGHSRFAFTNLIAWDEIHQLGTCNGLTNTLGQTVINWAGKGSDTWLKRQFAPNEDMAASLRNIVLINRQNGGNLIDGKPAGQRAFALLEQRFPDTKATQATKYWYFRDVGCGSQ